MHFGAEQDSPPRRFPSETVGAVVGCRLHLAPFQPSPNDSGSLFGVSLPTAVQARDDEQEAPIRATWLVLAWKLGGGTVLWGTHLVPFQCSASGSPLGAKPAPVA